MRSRFATHLIALVAVCLLMAAMAGSTHGARFFGLGDLPGGTFSSHAHAVSADGSVVVGYSSISQNGTDRDAAFRWTSGQGMVSLGDVYGGSYQSYAWDVSADGSVIVGEVGGSGARAFRWTSGGSMVGLVDVAEAHAVSADGSVIVGGSFGMLNLALSPCRWTSDRGMVILDPVFATAVDVSADGSVIVGNSNTLLGYGAFRWTSNTGMVSLGDFRGRDFYSYAYAVSADGSVIVGANNSPSGAEAFRWTSGGGIVGLGDLPGGDHSSHAFSVSADGSVIVGNSGAGAFIWDTTNGMRNLRDVLSELLSPAGSAALDHWTLGSAMAISADGLTIVGDGTNPSGKTEAWVAYLGNGNGVPEPASWMLLGIGLTVVLATRRASRFD